MALLGRSGEQEALARLLASARLGRGGVLLVVGEPGAGKTALLAAALDTEGARGMRVLRAVGTEAEQDLPFAALHVLLRPALPFLDQLPEPQADALGAALRLRPGSGRDRFAIGAATLSLLSRYAEDAPLVVLLDDAQWMDRPSVEALAFAARRLADDPVAVLTGVRRGEVPDPLRDAPVLELVGLSREAAAELQAEAGGGRLPPASLERLYQVTGGNPLALLELGRDPDAVAAPDPPVLPQALPVRLQEVFGRRLDAMAPEDREVALVASVCGEDLRLTLAVCAMLGLDPDGLERAAAAGLLRLEGQRLAFAHPLLRSAVHGSVPAHRRRLVHRAVAELLDPAEADRRAWHLAAGSDGLDEDVARELVQLGARAEGRSAFSVASTALERAAHLSPDARAARVRLVAAAEAAWAGGQAERALRLLDEAEPEPGRGRGDRAPVKAEPVGPSGTGATGVSAPLPPPVAAAGLRAMIEVRAGSVRQGLGMLEHAAALAPPDAAVHLLAEACRACMYLVDMHALSRVLARMSAVLAGVADPETRAVGLAASGAAGLLLGQDTAARLREALPLLADHVDPRRPSAAVPWLLMAPLFLRDIDAGDGLDRLVDDVRDQVGVGALPNMLFLVARDQATSTGWGRAAANYDEAARLARETGQGAELAVSLAGMAALDSRAGRSAPCRAHAAEALRLSRDRSLNFGVVWCEQALGELALAEGAAAQAADRLGRLADRLQELGVGDPDLHPGPDLVDALLRAGRAAEAATVAEHFGQLATATGRPWALARADRAGVLTADETGADAAYRSAMSHHSRTRDVFETARTQLSYGMRLRRAGRRVDARVVLREALATFDELGALLWADSTRAELAATGERVPPRDPLGPGALTPQELQVCLLLARGRTTRETAAALFLSPKTVEYHLRKAYTKLAISSRAELAAVLRNAV